MANIELVDSGMRIDGSLIVCSVDIESGRGGARYDKQSRKGGLVLPTDGDRAGDGVVAGASVLTYVWTGWNPLEITIRVILTGQYRHDYFDFLHRIAHGETPSRHTLLGLDRTVRVLKSPVFIEDFSWQEPNAAEAIFVTMLCVEEDPEKVALKTEPDPVAPTEQQDQEDQPVDALTSQQHEALDELERLIAQQDAANQ